MGWAGHEKLGRRDQVVMGGQAGKGEKPGEKQRGQSVRGEEPSVECRDQA